MSGGIFVSYRRDDTQHAAGRLVERLSRSLPNSNIFIDIDSISPGLDFKKVLSEKVASCDVVLVLIGPKWLNSIYGAGSPRLFDPRDFVRIELEAALNRNILVVPILIDGARMPREEELPEPLRGLCYRNAVQLTHTDFAASADRLGQTLFDAARIRENARATGSDTGGAEKSIAALLSDFARRSVATLTAPEQSVRLGAHGWVANTMRWDARSVEFQIEKEGNAHSVALELKIWRLRDRLIVDGKDDWFFIHSTSISRPFGLAGSPDKFRFLAKLSALGRIKVVELTANGQLMLRQTN